MPFNGVSTKYINNYLAWFKFLQLSKKNKMVDRIKDMLVNVATKETLITRATIRHRLIELVYNNELFYYWKVNSYYL